jgi:hypothetical protein
MDFSFGGDPVIKFFIIEITCMTRPSSSSSRFSRGCSVNIRSTYSTNSFDKTHFSERKEKQISSLKQKKMDEMHAIC